MQEVMFQTLQCGSRLRGCMIIGVYYLCCGCEKKLADQDSRCY